MPTTASLTGMTTYVGLLRGINLGSHNNVPMTELRRILADLGHDEVRTYIASGNAVFASDRDEPTTIGAEIRDRLADELDVSPTVMVLPADEFTAIADANPYRWQAQADPTRVHVGFLSAVPADPEIFAFDPASYDPEELTLDGRALYLHLPNGMGRSPLAVDLGRRASDVEVTLRNWRTVTKLLEMLEAGRSR